MQSKIYKINLGGKMKKILSICLVLSFVSVAVFANPLDKFNDVMNSAGSHSQARMYLDHLSKDMGKVMTGGNYGVSGNMGLGSLDIGINLNTTLVGNEIMRAEGTSRLYVPTVRASLGLVYGFDLIGKYAYFYGSNLYGLGLRYNVYESSILFIPSITVQGMYSFLNISSNSNKVNNNNIAFGAVATFPVPFVTPYIGVGWDRTYTKAKSSNYEGLSTSTDKMTYGFGVAVSILMIKGSLGIAYNHGIPNYTVGLNLGF